MFFTSCSSGMWEDLILYFLPSLYADYNLWLIPNWALPLFDCWLISFLFWFKKYVQGYYLSCYLFFFLDNILELIVIIKTIIKMYLEANNLFPFRCILVPCLGSAFLFSYHPKCCSPVQCYLNFLSSSPSWHSQNNKIK